MSAVIAEGDIDLRCGGHAAAARWNELHPVGTWVRWIGVPPWHTRPGDGFVEIVASTAGPAFACSDDSAVGVKLEGQDPDHVFGLWVCTVLDGPPPDGQP